MKYPLRLLFSLVILGSVVALAQPTVVTSIHPIYAVTQEIAGDHAEVVRLLPPGVSPHTFDPTPRDVAQLSDADFMVMNGVLDEWLLEMAEAVNADAPLLELVADLDFEPMTRDSDQGDHGEAGSEAEGGSGGADQGAHDHDHSGVDPHIWLDPTLMAQVAPLIAERLAEVDPDNAASYRSNGERVATNLNDLDAELQETLEPVRGAAFVPFHGAWSYFTRRYGLDLVVEIEPAPGREPSPAYLAEALDLIQGTGAEAIFSEVQLSPRPAEVVAESAGLPLYVLDPVGGGSETESYADLLRYNATTIREALGGE